MWWAAGNRIHHIGILPCRPINLILFVSPNLMVEMTLIQIICLEEVIAPPTKTICFQQLMRMTRLFDHINSHMKYMDISYFLANTAMVDNVNSHISRFFTSNTTLLSALFLIDYWSGWKCQRWRWIINIFTSLLKLIVNADTFLPHSHRSYIWKWW